MQCFVASTLASCLFNNCGPHLGGIFLRSATSQILLNAKRIYDIMYGGPFEEGLAHEDPTTLGCTFGAMIL